MDLTSSKFYCSIVTLIAIAPFVGLQLFDILTINLRIWLVYYFPISVSVVFGAWIIYLYIEIVFRILLNQSRYPWFSLIGFCFLCLYILGYSHKLSKPIVSLNPKWCRAYRVIRWETEGNLGYVLVLTGYGNNKIHKLTGGYLNWTGDESGAGMSTFNFESMTNGYFYEEEALTLENFSSHVENTKLSDIAKQLLIKEIWKVLQQAQAGNPIFAEHGIIEPLKVEAEDYASGIVWIPLLIIIFSVFGCLTLKTKNQI